jgi:hypothetical protein
MHCVSGKQMSRFAAGVASTLFSCESWISMWKECLPNESLWQWRIIHSLKNTHFRRNAHSLVAQGRMQYVRGRNSLPLVSLWEMSYLLKGILTTPQFIHVWGRSPLGQIAAFNWMEPEQFRMYEKHSFQQQEGLDCCLKVRIEWALQRNTTCLSGIYSVKKITFVEKSPVSMEGRSTVSPVRDACVRSKTVKHLVKH